MTAFWFTAAALVVVALVFLLPPLLRGAQREALSAAGANLEVLRDQMRELDGDLSRGTISPQLHAQAKQELERRLIDEVGAVGISDEVKTAPAKRGVAIALALLLPVAAGSIYWRVGNPSALIAENRTGVSEADLAQQQKVLDLTKKLAEKMRERPDDPVGWAMLGRAYKMTEQFEESVKAFARAVKLNPNNAEVLTEFAEAKMLAQAGQLDSEGQGALKHALQLDPNNQRSLALAGTVAYESGQFAAAIAYWERLGKLVPPDSPFAKSLNDGIAQARAQLSTGDSKPTIATEQVSGKVRLGDVLKSKVKPEDTVFVFARAVSGPRMPLAIIRAQVKDLPLNFALDDSMAMSPQAKLSGAAEVVIGARISASGNPIAQPGDLEGKSGVVKPGASDVTITIDTILK